MDGPAAFFLISFIGAISALVGVYGATGGLSRRADPHYPSMG